MKRRTQGGGLDNSTPSVSLVRPKAVVSRCTVRNLICNENHTQLDLKPVAFVGRLAHDLDCNTKNRWLPYWQLATGGVCQGLPIWMVIPAGAVSALSRTPGVCSRAHGSIGNAAMERPSRSLVFAPTADQVTEIRELARPAMAL